MNNKISLNFTVIALAVVLASCGGGGSDGYYNNGSGNSSSTNPSTGEAVKTVNISAVQLIDRNKW